MASKDSLFVLISLWNLVRLRCSMPLNAPLSRQKIWLCGRISTGMQSKLKKKHEQSNQMIVLQERHTPMPLWLITGKGTVCKLTQVKCKWAKWSNEKNDKGPTCKFNFATPRSKIFYLCISEMISQSSPGLRNSYLNRSKSIVLKCYFGESESRPYE